MSERYVGGWEQAGLFNPLNAPSGSTYKQYGGVWTLSQASDAVAQGKWSGPHLYAWGNNAQGQLGLGNITSYSSPKQLGALTNWLTVSAGGSYQVAIKTDGTLWSWGNNVYGTLGLGNITKYSSPKQVGSLTTWTVISCGTNCVTAIAST